MARDYVSGLVTAYREAERECLRAEQEVTAKREARDRLKRAVAILAPEELPKPKGKKKETPNHVSAAALDRTRLALQSVNGGEFTAAQLKQLPELDFPEVGTLKRALKELHDYGELRLVRQRVGGQKVYEVIR